MSNTSLVFDASKTTQDEWNALFSQEHPKALGTGTPIWYYEHNQCTDCGNPLMLCRDNPYGYFGSITEERKRLQAEARAHREADEAAERAEGASVKVAKAERAATDGPRARGRRRTTRLGLDEAEKPEVLAKYDAGTGMVLLAKEYNVPPVYMSAFLKENNRTVARGKGAGLEKARAVRKEAAGNRPVKVARPPRQKKVYPPLTEALLKEFVERFQRGEKISTFVAESGIPQPLISAGLKANNCVVKKGRKATPVASLVTA